MLKSAALRGFDGDAVPPWQVGCDSAHSANPARQDPWTVFNLGPRADAALARTSSLMTGTRAALSDSFNFRQQGA